MTEPSNTQARTDGERFAPWLVLFSQHMPEACDDDTVSCSCGSPLYVGHMVRKIAERAEALAPADPALIEAAHTACSLWEGERPAGDVLNEYQALCAAMSALRRLLPVPTPPHVLLEVESEDPTHECVFVEEQEPAGRLILPPCIVCGLSAMDALEQLRQETGR